MQIDVARKQPSLFFLGMKTPHFREVMCKLSCFWHALSYNEYVRSWLAEKRGFGIALLLDVASAWS